MRLVDRLPGLRRPLASLSDQAIVSLANFTTILLFARTLSVTDFGVFAIVLSVFLALTAVQTAAVGRIHNVVGARREADDFRSFSGHMLLLQSAVMAVFVLPTVVAGAGMWLAGKEAIGRIVVCSAVVGVPWLFQDTVRRMLYTERRMGRILLNDGVCYGLQLLGAVLLALGLVPATLFAALVIYLIATGAGSVIGVVQLRLMGCRIDRASVRTDLREAWEIGRHLTIAELIGLMSGNAASWMLAALVGLPALAAYRASVQIANGLNPILSTAGIYLPAITSEHFAKLSVEEFQRWYRATMLGLSAMVGAIVILVIIEAETIIGLVYGTRYDSFPVALILQITVAVRLLGFVRGLLFDALVVAGDARASVIDRLVQLGLIAVVGVPLIQVYQGVGVAVWHGVKAVISTTYGYLRFRKIGADVSNDESGSGSLIVGSGAEGTVTRSPDGRTVRKRFTRADRNPERAESEYRLLRRLHEVADRAPVGVRAPAPVTFHREQHTIEMEHCDGVQLDILIRDRSPDREEIEVIAERLSVGLQHFVEATGQPYHDFCTQNLLWDRSEGVLTVLDMGNHLMTMPARPIREPYAVSLGNYLGRMIYTAARPSHLVHPLDIVRNARLYRGLAAGLRDRGIAPYRNEVVRLALHRYVEMGGGGRMHRRAWYFTVGIPFMAAGLALALLPAGPPTGGGTAS